MGPGGAGGVILESPQPAKKKKKLTSYPMVRWVFTLKSESRSAGAVGAVLSGICKEFYFQEEQGAGEQAYKHYQGCFALKEKHRLLVVKNMIGFNDIHLEGCKDWICAKKYSQKEETRINGPWSHVKPPLNPRFQLQLGAFYNWQTTVKGWLEEEPDDRHITWIYDETGGNGKTKFVLYCVDNLGAVRYNSGKESDIAYSYNSESIVLFDFQRAKQFINYSTMEDLKNGHLFSGKYESSAKRFNPPHVIVFANNKPSFSDLSLDRWKVFKLENKELVREYEFVIVDKEGTSEYIVLPQDVVQE